MLQFSFTVYGTDWAEITKAKTLLEKNGFIADNGAAPKATRKKKTTEEPEDLEEEEVTEDEDLDLGADDEEEEEVIAFETIRKMVSTKAVDPAKKKAIKALLTKHKAAGLQALDKKHYAAFFAALQKI